MSSNDNDNNDNNNNYYYIEIEILQPTKRFSVCWPSKIVEKISFLAIPCLWVCHAAAIGRYHNCWRNILYIYITMSDKESGGEDVSKKESDEEEEIDLGELLSSGV